MGMSRKLKPKTKLWEQNQGIDGSESERKWDGNNAIEKKPNDLISWQTK